MKVVLDTNVLVSGLLTPRGTCATVLQHVIEGHLEPCLDPRMLSEYRRVCRHPRLKLHPAHVDGILDFIVSVTECILPPPLRVTLPDPDDLPFLETAAHHRAILVTGNVRHFPSTRVQPVAVITPAALLALLAGRMGDRG